MTISARKHLARRIKALRQSHGWSQEVLAELCGLNRSYIGAVERAEHNIGLDNIQRIATALEISITDLISDPAIEKPVDEQSNTQGTEYGSSPVIIYRQSLLELLNLANQSSSELILVYLQRCGAIIRDRELE